MTFVVPATEREVDASHKCEGLINDNDLLMMSPEQNTRDEDVRVAEEL